MAILPCAWGYAEIGQELATRKMKLEQPLYKKWIDMYSSEEFANLAEWLREYIDREALLLTGPQKRELEGLFLISSEYEYQFWDSSYEMRTWPFES